jgi:calcium-dependent protein kinase
MENVADNYEFGKVLGNGQFGVVREATKLKSTSKTKYAIKSINKTSLEGQEQLLQRELEILHKLDHPNVIKLYEIYEDNKYIHLVTEVCTGGDLFDRIVTLGGYPET